MTRKSKSRKRKFGSTTKDTEDSSEEIDEEGVRKLKLKLNKIQLEEQIKNKEAEIKETEEVEQKEKEAKEKAKAKYEEAIKIFKEKHEGAIKTFKEKNKLDDNTNEVKGYAAAKIQGFFRKSKKLQLKKQQDFLIDLEKDFPPSKESSISFPNIDKVNKKLSDLFDYIGKYTMEESEETKELEKQQIEAEIEKTKAEAKQAIRESERKFGVWRSDIENSTGRKEEDDDDEIEWNDDVDYGSKYNDGDYGSKYKDDDDDDSDSKQIGESKFEGKLDDSERTHESKDALNSLLNVASDSTHNVETERIGKGKLSPKEEQELRKKLEKQQQEEEENQNKINKQKIEKNTENILKTRENFIKYNTEQTEKVLKTKFTKATVPYLKKQINECLTLEKEEEKKEEEKNPLYMKTEEKTQLFGFLDKLAKLEPLETPDFKMFTLLLMKIMAYIFTNPKEIIKNKKDDILSPGVKSFLYESTKKADNLDIIQIINKFTPPGQAGYEEIKITDVEIKRLEEQINDLNTKIRMEEVNITLATTDIKRIKEDLDKWKHVTEGYMSQLEKSRPEQVKKYKKVKQQLEKEISTEIQNFKEINKISNLTEYCNKCGFKGPTINETLAYNKKLGNDELKKEWNLLNLNTEKAQEIYKTAYDELRQNYIDLYIEIAKKFSDENTKGHDKAKVIINEIFDAENFKHLDYNHKKTFQQLFREIVEDSASKNFEVQNELTKAIAEFNRTKRTTMEELAKHKTVKKLAVSKKNKLTIKKESNKQYYKNLFKKLQEESIAFKKSYEQGRKVDLMFKDFKYQDLDDFITKNSLQDDLIEKLQEKYINFKILEENDFGSSDTPKKQTLTKLLDKCTQLIKHSKSKDPRKEKTIQGKFMIFYNDVNKVILEAFPVKSIINFSTNVKPPDEGGLSRETYTEGIDYKNNKQELKTKFTINNVNMLDKDKKTPESTENPHGILKEELGNTLVMINSKDKYNDKGEKNDEGTNKTYGPFYKILHTSNTDSNKKQYDVKEDLNRFFDPKDNLDHITYAGYGFSGSGKTFTLIEGTHPTYNSIVNQISEYIQANDKRLSNVEIKIYERYEEIIDDGCTDLVKSIFGKSPIDPKLTTSRLSTNSLKKYGVFRTIQLKDDVKIEGLAGTIHDINEKREKQNELASTQLYRTSIRRTTFNPESSRAHLFVDITFDVNGKKKKITVMDMAGSEKVNVIQKDYFESVEKRKVDINLFETKVEDLVDQTNGFPSIKSYSEASGSNNKLKNSGQIKKAIKAINENLIKTGGKDNYIIPIKWQELFFGTPVRNKTNENILTHSADPNKRKHSVSYNQGWKVPNAFGSTRNRNQFKVLEEDTSSDEEETTDVVEETTVVQKTTPDDVWKEHQDFVNNYNDNQFTAKYKLLLDFNDALKKLEKRVNGTSNPVKLKKVVNAKRKELSFPDQKEWITFKVIKSKLTELFTACDLPEGIIVNNFNVIMNIFNEVKDPTKSENYTAIYSSNDRSTSLCRTVIDFMGIIEDKIDELDKMFNPRYSTEEKSNIHNQKEKIEKKIRKSSPDYEIKSLFKKDTEVQDINKAYNTKEKWDRTMITKYHCPLRFQGNAIMRSIEQFKQNLQRLNKEKVNFLPDRGNFPYYITDWTGPKEQNGQYELKNKNFVIFTNIRLDFTDELCTNPRYLPICNAYDDSLQFSHDLLYSEQQEVDPDYEKKVENVFTDSSNFGKKKVKKTSTRSFRKRGRRRGPSETEIL